MKHKSCRLRELVDDRSDGVWPRTEEALFFLTVEGLIGGGRISVATDGEAFCMAS